MRHLSLFIIDPSNTPKQKPTNDNQNTEYEYYAGNEQFGSRDSSFLYVDDIAASLAKPPTIGEIVAKNQNYGYKVHQLIPVPEGRLLDGSGKSVRKKDEIAAFVRSFCAMLAGIFKRNNSNQVEQLSVYASRKHLPLQPSFSDWGLNEWQHYKWSSIHSRTMMKKLQELEEAPLRPVDIFLAEVIKTLSNVRSITLHYDCLYIFQLSYMRHHIAAIVELPNLTELKLNFNLGDSDCLLYEKNDDSDDELEHQHRYIFPVRPSKYLKKKNGKPHLFQSLIPKLEKLSLRGQFTDEQLACALKVVSPKMKELKISRLIYGRVAEAEVQVIQSSLVLSSVKLACWSVYTQLDVSNCVHLYPNAETLQLEICQVLIHVLLCRKTY